MKTNHPFSFRHVIIFTILALAVILLLIRFSRSYHTRSQMDTGDLLVPGLSTKPAPKEIVFHGCPPEGDGGDRELNLLKNRVDTGDYVMVTLDAILKLPWPHSTERRNRKDWSPDAKALIARNEGVPLVVEGYFLRVKQEGPESPNCKEEDPDFRDFHIWLAGASEDDERNAMVVEMTPRVRAEHPSWTRETILKIAHDRRHVRVSGWLLFDQEHPDQVEKSRATLWEIHPIMKVEVEEAGRWIPIESRQR